MRLFTASLVDESSTFSPIPTSIVSFREGLLHRPSRSELVPERLAMNPAIQCIGVSLNSSKVPVEDREILFARYAAETGLPRVDPLIDGVAPIVDRLFQGFAACN
jgi:hypothetical protein